MNEDKSEQIRVPVGQQSAASRSASFWAACRREGKAAKNKGHSSVFVNMDAITGLLM